MLYPGSNIFLGSHQLGRIQRKYNVPFEIAYNMENQPLALGLGALWAGAGAKYSWKGNDDCTHLKIIEESVLVIV